MGSCNASKVVPIASPYGPVILAILRSLTAGAEATSARFSSSALLVGLGIQSPIDPSYPTGATSALPTTGKTAGVTGVLAMAPRALFAPLAEPSSG